MSSDFEADKPSQPDNWSNLSTFVCKTCMFYCPKATSAVGRCRRHAPAVEKGWPAVYPGDWCGEHKLGAQRG